MFMMMFILDDPIHLDKVLDTWSNLEVSGITVVESSGLYAHPLNRASSGHLYGDSHSEQRGNFTIFAFAETEGIVQMSLEKVEQIVGDLNEPNTGIFTFWPLSSKKGNF